MEIQVAMLIGNIRKVLRNNFPKFHFQYITLKLMFSTYFLSDEEFVKKKYIRNFGHEPNLVNPEKYNEHLSKILLTPPSKTIARCVDKYEVRNYVIEKVGDDILNKFIGIYYSVKDLEKAWEKLPNKFVLKATHGCGWNYICKNKEEVNFQDVRREVKKWLKSNFYYAQRELVYKYLEPKIVCEKYLEDESGSLMDYKIHCFKGVPQFINVIVDRFSDMKLNTYDMKWNYIDVSFDSNYPSDKNAKYSKPKVFDQLIEYSKLLSEEFEYVRVDFYIVEDKIYFGELTFTPGNGAYQFTEEQDLFFGNFFNK